MSFLKIQLIAFIAKTTLKHSLNYYKLGGTWRFCLILEYIGIFWEWCCYQLTLPSLEQPQCTALSMFALCALTKLVACPWPCPLSWPFSCPTFWNRVQKQNGLVAHHFYYGYLLLPCCVSKTNAVRFRLQTPAKLSRAASGSLSQQHPAACLDVDVGEARSPAAYQCIAPQPCSWTHGLQMCSSSLEQSWCICWAGSRGAQEPAVRSSLIWSDALSAKWSHLNQLLSKKDFHSL